MSTKVRGNDMKFESIVISVSDVGRAEEFYGRLGPKLDAEFAKGEDIRRDPHGNGWLLQEVTPRQVGRIDSGATSFASANDLADAFRRAEAAHGKYEARLDQWRDAKRPAWYAAYGVTELAGTELPS